jgi:hypothetical protein
VRHGYCRPVKRATLLAAISLGAIGLAYVLPMQSVGCAQTAHYAAERAFASGRATIDHWSSETCDSVRVGGHVYAAKGPLMDLLAAPWYIVLRTVGAVPPNRNAGQPYPAAMTGIPLRAIWQMGLWAVVLPSLLLLVLVRRTVERYEPGLGTACAAILGLGTLLLPFSTLLFAHALAALLIFASFVLLLDGGSGFVRIAAAGALAGLAVSTDIPLAIPAAALGVYAAARSPRARRVVEYGAGGLIGLLPLLLFDWWAFGTPFHLPYSGQPGQGAAGGWAQEGFFGLGKPSPRMAVELLLSQRGLFVLTPVTAAGLAGIYLLWRQGLRAEAVLIGTMSLAVIVWDSGRIHYAFALGGWVPGPRFLIPLLPFLCFALAPVLRRLPATVAVLAAVSIGAMAVATAAEPLIGNDDTRSWLVRIVHGNFAATVLSLGGVGHGWLAILPFFAFVLVGAGAAVAATPPLPVGRRDLVVAAVALVAWILVEHGAPELLRVDRAVGKDWGVAAAVLLVAALVWTVIRVRADGLRSALPAVPLFAFATVRFDEHTKWALLLVLIVLTALALVRPLTGRVRRSGIPA